MVRARLHEHVVEQAATAPRGASGTLAIRGSDEGLVGVLPLPLTALVLRGLLLSFLPPLLLLSGGLGFAAAALPGRIFLVLTCLAVEDGADRLLARGKVGGDIEQHIRAGGTASRELVHQIPTRCALEEGIDDLDVGDAGELGALLGEASDVVAQGLVGLLLAPSKILGVPRAHVSALEVAHEDPDQVVPVADLVRGQVLEPYPCRVCEVQRKVANDHGVIYRVAQLASQAVVVEPE